MKYRPGEEEQIAEFIRKHGMTQVPATSKPPAEWTFKEGIDALFGISTYRGKSKRPHLTRARLQKNGIKGAIARAAHYKRTAE